MTANRRTLAPSNTAGAIAGTDLMEDINDEVSGLWRRAAVRLTSVAGTNTITASAEVPLLANESGNQFWFTPANSNTGSVTLNVDGRGALPLRDASGNALPAGYLSASRIETVINLGTEFRLTMPNLAGAAGSTILRALVAYQQPTNTHGGSATGGARTRYPFNTIISNTIPGLSLDAVTNIGRLTVPARAFERIEARCTFNNVQASIFLRNISDAADVTGIARVSMNDKGAAQFTLKTTLAAAKQLEVQYYCASGQATDGLGVKTNDAGGAPEQYGFIEFTSYG